MFGSDSDEDETELAEKSVREDAGTQSSRSVDVCDPSGRECEEHEVTEGETQVESELDQLANLNIANESYADYCGFLLNKKEELAKDLGQSNKQLDETIDANEAEINDLLAFTTKFVQDFGFPASKWRGDRAAFVQIYKAAEEKDLGLQTGVTADLEQKRALLDELKVEEVRLSLEKDHLSTELREVGAIEGKIKSLSGQLDKEKREGEALLLKLQGEVEQLERAFKLRTTNRPQAQTNQQVALVSRPSAQIVPQIPNTSTNNLSNVTQRFGWQAPSTSSSLAVQRTQAVTQNFVRPSNFVARYNHVVSQPSRPSNQPIVAGRSFGNNLSSSVFCAGTAASQAARIPVVHRQQHFAQSVKPEDNQHAGSVSKLSVFQQKALENEMLLRTIAEEQERIRRNQQTLLAANAVRKTHAPIGGQSNAQMPPIAPSKAVPMSRELVPLAKRIKLEREVSGVQVEEIHDEETGRPPFWNPMVAVARGNTSGLPSHGRFDGIDDGSGAGVVVRGKLAAAVAPSSWTLPRQF